MEATLKRPKWNVWVSVSMFIGSLNCVLDGLNDSTRMLSVVDKDEWKQQVDVPVYINLFDFQVAHNGEICRMRLKLPDGKVEIIEITSNSKLKVGLKNISYPTILGAFYFSGWS